MESYIRKVMRREDSHTIEISRAILTDGTVLKSKSNGSVKLFYHTPRGEGDRHYIDLVSSTTCQRFFNLDSFEFYDEAVVLKNTIDNVCAELHSKDVAVTVKTKDKVTEYVVNYFNNQLYSPYDFIDIEGLAKDFIKINKPGSDSKDEMSGL